MTKKLPVSACVVAAAVVLFLWDHLFAGQTFYLRDVIFDALPWRRFAARELVGGSIPLWNPHSRFGQPFLANPQSAVLYPPHLLFLVLPVAWAFKMNMLGHLLLGGISMSALLRRFELHHGAAALGGIVWALGGYMTANLEFMSVMETLAWCPLTVLLAVRLTDTPRDGRALRAAIIRGSALALVIAVQFLAGQAQPLAYTLALAVGFLGVAARTGETPWWSRGTHDEFRVARAAGAVFVVAIAAAAGLTALQWMPTRELLPLSIRAGVDPGLDIASAHPRHLLHLVDPLFSGSPGAAAWHGGTLFEFWLGSIYVGLLPLALVPAAFTLRRADGRVAWLPVAGGFFLFWGLLLALGRHTPLYSVLLDVVPGFDLFRWPAKAFQLVVFSLSVLAAAGMHALLAARSTESSRVRIVAITAATACAAVAAILWLTADGGHPRPLVFGVLALVGAAALGSRHVPVRVALAMSLALVVVDLYGVSRQIHLVDDDGILDAVPTNVPPLDGGRAHTDYTYAQFQIYGSRDAAEYARAIDLLAGDTGLSIDLDRTYGGDALQVATAAEATALLDVLPDVQRGRLADVFGVKAWLTGPGFPLLRDGSMRATWVPHPSDVPRAHVVATWETQADPTSAMERLLSPDFDPTRSAIVGVAGAPAPAPGPLGARIGVARFERERVDVGVEVRRRALLVVSDTWLPGWRARVDGAERDILPVNVIFRGVVLEPGDRNVVMTYEPPAFESGLRWSAFSALALVALLVSVLYPRKRPPAVSAD